MPDDPANPYAPPADQPDVDAPTADEPPRRRHNEFELERRPVGLCILLTVLTCGLYSGFWLLRRRPFLDHLRTDTKLGSLPMWAIGLSVASWVVAFAAGALKAPEVVQANQMLSLGAGITTLIANFRVAAILRSEFARSGRLLSVSSLATFFLGIFYLQYKINQGADVAPRRRKKKTKDADASTEDLARAERAK